MRPCSLTPAGALQAGAPGASCRPRRAFSTPAAAWRRFCASCAPRVPADAACRRGVSWPLRLSRRPALPLRAHHARRPVGLGLVAAGSGLPLPAPGEHAARMDKDAPRAAPAPGWPASDSRAPGLPSAVAARAALSRCGSRPALKRPATIAGYRGRKTLLNRRRRAARRTPDRSTPCASCCGFARLPGGGARPHRIPPSTDAAPPSWRRPLRPPAAARTPPRQPHQRRHRHQPPRGDAPMVEAAPARGRATGVRIRARFSRAGRRTRIPRPGRPSARPAAPGAAPSFEALAQSVTRDMHPRSLLEETAAWARRARCGDRHGRARARGLRAPGRRGAHGRLPWAPTWVTTSTPPSTTCWRGRRALRAGALRRWPLRRPRAGAAAPAGHAHWQAITQGSGAAHREDDRRRRCRRHRQHGLPPATARVGLFSY